MFTVGHDQRHIANSPRQAIEYFRPFLDVIINGSGSVEYIGHPKVTASRNGSGSVDKKR